jgi:hypothetical protein
MVRPNFALYKYIKLGRFQIATSCMEESRIPKGDL